VPSVGLVAVSSENKCANSLGMARPEGLEPSTPGLEDRCAIQVRSLNRLHMEPHNRVVRSQTSVNTAASGVIPSALPSRPFSLRIEQAPNVSTSIASDAWGECLSLNQPTLLAGPCLVRLPPEGSSLHDHDLEPRLPTQLRCPITRHQASILLVLVSAPPGLIATFTASSIGSLKGTSIRSNPFS
jgi:hypothetical protein